MQEVEDKKDPAFVPRDTRYFLHDDRFDQSEEQADVEV